MDCHRDRRRKTILREIQDWIEEISRNIDKLQKELNLYQKITTEMGDNNESEIDYSEAEDTSDDTLMVIKPDTHLQPKKELKNKQCGSKRSERKEALEKARAWYLARIW